MISPHTQMLMFWAGWGVAVVGAIGLWLAFRFIRQDDREHAEAMGQQQTANRIIPATAFALLLASAVIYADENGACTEATLRAACGDFWELCWWTFGCYALPG